MATHDNPGFLGRGWSFPPRFAPDRGEIELVSREDDIRESLRILFQTRKGERIMQPSYGCALHDLVFEPMNAGTQAAIKLAITRAILFFEPRIDLKEVTIRIEDSENGRLAIQLDYLVRATNSRHNVVFPYYITEGTLLSGAAVELPG